MKNGKDEKQVNSMSDSLGTVLKRLRTDRGLLQDEVGKQIGVKRATVAAYEAGRIVPPPDKMHEIARIYGVDEEKLFSLTVGSSKEESVPVSTGYQRTANELLKSYRKMSDEAQDAIYGLVKDLYKEGRS